MQMYRAPSTGRYNRRLMYDIEVLILYRERYTINY